MSIPSEVSRPSSLSRDYRSLEVIRPVTNVRRSSLVQENKTIRGMELLVLVMIQSSIYRKHPSERICERHNAECLYHAGQSVDLASRRRD